MKVIVTRASAATVARWATAGPKRLRAKYRNARTLCRIVNPRHGGPIVGLAGGQWGRIGRAKAGWFGGFPARLWIGGLDMSVPTMRALVRAIRGASVATGYGAACEEFAGHSDLSMEALNPRRSRRRCRSCKGPRDQWSSQCAACNAAAWRSS